MLNKFRKFILIIALVNSIISYDTNEQVDEAFRNLQYIIPVSLKGIPGFEDSSIVQGDTISYINITNITESVDAYMKNNTATIDQLNVFSNTIYYVICK